MGALPDGAKGRGRNWGNCTDGDGRGATEMLTCSLLYAKKESPLLLVPTSSPRQYLQGIFSAGLKHPKLQRRAASFLEGHNDTHRLLHRLILVEEASRGAEQVPGPHGEESTEPKMRTPASQRPLPSQETTM